MPAPDLQASALGTVALSGVVTFVDPSTPGQRLLAFVVIDSDTDTVAAPDGTWLPVITATVFAAGDGHALYVFEKLSSAGAGGNLDFTPSVNYGRTDRSSGILLSYSGAAATSGTISDKLSDPATQASPIIIIDPSITTLVPNTRLIAVAVPQHDNNASAITYTVPAGFGNLVEFIGTTYCKFATSDMAFAGPGATGTQTWSLATLFGMQADGVIGVLIAIPPQGLQNAVAWLTA